MSFLHVPVYQCHSYIYKCTNVIPTCPSVPMSFLHVHVYHCHTCMYLCNYVIPTCSFKYRQHFPCNKIRWLYLLITIKMNCSQNALAVSVPHMMCSNAIVMSLCHYAIVIFMCTYDIVIFMCTYAIFLAMASECTAVPMATVYSVHLPGYSPYSVQSFVTCLCHYPPPSRGGE